MATGLDLAEAVIESMLTAAFPAVAISFANIPFTPPESTAWLRATIEWGTGALSTKPGRQTVVGIVQVEVYTPIAQGGGACRRLSDQVRAVYNSKEEDGVRFRVPSGPRQTREDTPWYRRLVVVPFSVDELV